MSASELEGQKKLKSPGVLAEAHKVERRMEMLERERKRTEREGRAKWNKRRKKGKTKWKKRDWRTERERNGKEEERRE